MSFPVFGAKHTLNSHGARNCHADPRMTPVYHIHQAPVPSDGNCTDTEAHLDPFDRGEVPPCNPDLPMTCQVGDLAGKHGAITTSQGSNTFETTYTDDYTAVSLLQNAVPRQCCVRFFADRVSIDGRRPIIHRQPKRRFAFRKLDENNLREFPENGKQQQHDGDKPGSDARRSRQHT